MASVSAGTFARAPITEARMKTRIVEVWLSGEGEIEVYLATLDLLTVLSESGYDEVYYGEIDGTEEDV